MPGVSHLNEETHEESQGTPLDKMKRADLEEMAVLAGMPEEEARAAKNMGALVEFIESQSAPDGNKNEEES